MEERITLVHASRQYNLDEYNRNFRRGNTFNGDDPEPEEIMRWPIEQEDEAKKELSKYECSYRHVKGFCKELMDVDEWSLEYAEYDDEGEFVSASGYVSAEDDPEYPYKKSKKRMFFDCLEMQGDDWGSDYDDTKEEEEKEITM